MIEFIKFLFNIIFWLPKKIVRSLMGSGPRAKVRGLFLGILVLTIFLGLLDYPYFFNQASDWLESKIKGIEKVNLPSYLVWIKRAKGMDLPHYWNRLFKLGLDLQGGTELIYEADVSKVPTSDRSSAVEGVRDVIERRVNAFGVSEPLVQTNKTGDHWRVIVELAGIKDVKEAIRQIGETPLLEFKEESAPQALTSEQRKAMDEYNQKAKEKAQNILKMALIPQADFSLLAQQFSEDPGSQSKGGDLDWFGKGKMIKEFEERAFTLKTNEITKNLVQSPFGYHIIKKIDERINEKREPEIKASHILIRTKSERDFVLEKEPWKYTGLSGKQLKRAEVQFDPNTGFPQIGLEFNDEGKKLFSEITTRNVGKPVAIFLDKAPISIPRVEEPIREGKAVITGDFDLKEAKVLAQRLNAGALPVPIALLGQQTVGATLGKESLDKSLKAGLIGLIIVALFLILYYRLPGLLAVLALGVYTILVLAIFKLWPVTLTLAGIAGFILSIGMAVDANILIFERLKEELKWGRPLSIALEESFKRAWTSIRDSNVSSLITCAILIWFGTSIVKGFAITLAIGILISMFSAITVTRTFMRLVVGEWTVQRLWWLGKK